jgi:hypothetical protein
MKETTPSKRQRRGARPYHRLFATPATEQIGPHSWESLMLAAHDVREFAKGRSNAAFHRLCYFIECLAEYADTVENEIFPGMTSAEFDPRPANATLSKIRATIEARKQEAPRGLALPIALKEGNMIRSYCTARATTAAMRAEGLRPNGGTCYLQDMHAFRFVGLAIRSTCGAGKQSPESAAWHCALHAYCKASELLRTVEEIRSVRQSHGDSEIRD